MIVSVFSVQITVIRVARVISRFFNNTRTSFPLLPIDTFLGNDSVKNFSGYCTLPLLAKILSQYTVFFIPKGSTTTRTFTV